MTHTHPLQKILAVCLALLCCVSAASGMFASAKDSFFGTEMIPGAVEDARTRISGNWEYVPVTVGNTNYAVLTDYLGENPEVIDVPGAIGGMLVLGWGAFCYDAVLRRGQVDFSDLSFFSYRMAIDELNNRNPFADLQGYELQLPDSFPANIANVWRSFGKSSDEIMTWLERFLDLEFASCAAKAFVTQPTNGVQTLIKYPVFRESKLYNLPRTIDLYAAMRKVVFTADGEEKHAYPGDGFLSPFLAYQYETSETAAQSLAILSKKDERGEDCLRVHISDKQVRKAFNKLRKDADGGFARRYYKGYADLSEGLAYYFSGAEMICSDCIHAALIEDVGNYCEELKSIPKTDGMLYDSVPGVEFCYGHGANEMSQSFKRIFRMFTLNFYAWHAILLAAGKK